MLLAIDAGNTNIKFAIYDEGRQRGIWRSSNDADRTADEHASFLAPLLVIQGLKPTDIKAAIISTVVPAGLFNLVTLCKRHFECDPMIVGSPEVDLDMKVLVDQPTEVGADRLVSAIAARAKYPGPLIVIDFGTATTFDVVDGDGAYRGGIIAPGINLSLQALHMAAAKLPLVAVRRPEAVIGRRTVSAIESGVFWGYVGLIEGLVARIKQEFGQPMTVIATGGPMSLFASATDAIDATDGDLVMRGLVEIHRRNSAVWRTSAA